MVTIKDIARECGVSVMTVSAVLNNKPGEVSAATRERVLAATKRMKYRPNALARRMVGKKLHTIGIADHNTDHRYWFNPYETLVFEGIFASARTHHWDLLYFAGHPIKDFEVSLEVYLDGRCDGMIYFSHLLNDDETDQIIDAGIPFVLIGASHFSHKKCSVVDVDNQAAVHDAVNHLFSLGHRRVAMFEGKGSTSSIQRVAAFIKAHEDAGIPFDEKNIYPAYATDESAYYVALEMLRQPVHIRPSAVYCFNDSVAFGLLKAAKELGISVPKELSVIGFDDVREAAASSPPLTTIRQPLREIGERAVEILIGLITETIESGYSETVPHTLVIRETTAPYTP